MTNGTDEETRKDRSGPREATQDGGGGEVLDSILQDHRDSSRVHCRANSCNCEFYIHDKRLLENDTKRDSEVSNFVCYFRKYYIRICLGCLSVMLLLLSVAIPYGWWMIDREAPYKFQDLKVQSGYPGQVVSISATITERTPGRVCGIVVNPQVVSENGHLAFANQTRLIAGESIQSMERTPSGKILFKTELQVPPTLSAGDARLIVPLEMICEDNQTHASRPIHASISSPWVIEKKPEGAPGLTCPRRAAP